MSEQFQPALHPGPDTLSAFLEGALPEHERAECLTHLADCPQCRDVLFLAQAAADTAEPAAPQPFWRKLFRPMPVVAALATALLVMFSIGLYRMIRSAEPHRQFAATAKPAIEPAPPALEPQATPARKATVHRAPPRREQTPPVLAQSAPPPPAAPALVPVPGVVAGAQALHAPAAAAPPQPSAARAAVASLSAPAQPAAAGVTGTITDPAGAVIPRAQIELKNQNTGATYSSASDAHGQFSIAGLPAGQYDLSVTSMGFQKFFEPSIQIQPETMARVDSTLQIGSTSQSVTVTAGAPVLNTESGEISHPVTPTPAAQLALNGRSLDVFIPLRPAYTLPDKSHPATFAVKDKLVVAADATGALFRSEDSGKTWKHVKGKWKGKVVSIALRANATFELTTDPASTWLSTDGRHWSKVKTPR